MAPLKKAASQPLKSSISGESEDSQQHGRSSTTLGAERAAAALRARGDRSTEQPDTASTTPPAVTVEQSQPLKAPDATSPALVSPSSIRPATSYIPSTSSPLNPSTVSDSSDPRASSDGQGRASDDSRSSQKRPQTANAASPRRLRPPPRPPIQRPRHSSTPDLAKIEESRQFSSPVSVHDLGSDYTRYFSPFSDSARSSFVSLHAHTSRRNSQTHALPVPPTATTNPFTTPNASTTQLSADRDPEKGAFVFVDDRLGAPYNEKGQLKWPLIGDKEEDDDDMHMPLPDDDVRYKAKLSDHFSRANIASTLGLFLMIFGLLFVFIALPIMSYAGIIEYSSGYSTPLDQMYKYYPDAEAWATVNNRTYPLLQNIRTGLIDKDTPDSVKTKIGANGDEYDLVFSDEFNDNNRTFYEGDDPYWFAPDIWYGATQDLDWYDPDAVTTWDGTLELRLDQHPNHNLLYRSGMLNSWNHLCFKGGIFEVSVSLPGPAAVMGLWPGAWTMGNLGRPGYLSTTEGLWPYTYNSCDVGITPNQSSYDGLSRLPGQRLPACTCPGEDHPTPGTGRGAPEIDIFEAGASYGGLPIATQSYQVAPFDIWYYPDYEFTAFPDYSISYTNGYTGGPFQQAISATTNLNRNWYDGKQYQKYSFEYVPGEGEESYIVWKVGDQTTFMMDGRAIGPNGNIAARLISEEPMSMILNLGFSHSWTEIMQDKLVFPTVMRVDYVRWYQKKDQSMVTCDPPGYETTQYIKDHMNAYTNPNFTKWSQTGHDWPKNPLTNPDVCG